MSDGVMQAGEAAVDQTTLSSAAIVRLREAVIARRLAGTSIEKLAKECNIKVSALKQFIYSKNINPRYTSVVKNIDYFMNKKFNAEKIDSVSLYSQKIDERIYDNILGRYIMYRRSLYSNRIVKLEVFINKNNDEITFEQNIYGIATRRKILGRVGKYGNNIFLKGLSFSIIDNNNLDFQNIIGEELISFRESDLNSMYIVSIFTSVAGNGEVITGNSILLKENRVKSGVSIGNYAKEEISDTIDNIDINEFFRKIENIRQIKFFTISYDKLTGDV